jgi:hypothetical protein
MDSKTIEHGDQNEPAAFAVLGPPQRRKSMILLTDPFVCSLLRRFDAEAGMYLDAEIREEALKTVGE